MPSLAPGWGTSKPCHHCHSGETEVYKDRRGLPQGSASHLICKEHLPIQGDAPPPLPPPRQTWIPGGILMRVSSPAGVPGAIPGGGVPGGGFFPGKGVQAGGGGYPRACRDRAGAWGAPHAYEPAQRAGDLPTGSRGHGDKPWVASSVPASQRRDGTGWQCPPSRTGTYSLPNPWPQELLRGHSLSPLFLPKAWGHPRGDAPSPGTLVTLFVSPWTP